MTTGNLEIEHKFVVGPEFMELRFFDSVRSLKPNHEFTSEVTDTYFYSGRDAKFILRHREDDRLQQFTLKTITGVDSAVRTEINLQLDMEAGNQQGNVQAFCSELGLSKNSLLKKSIRVFEFDDVEIVFYVATILGRSLRCVEIEALERTDIRAGLIAIERYEALLAFDNRTRETHSLFELLVLPSLV